MKITAWPIQLFLFRKKIFYEDKNVQGRRIKGAAIVVSNHTSVFDYAIWLFVFFSRTLRVQMAELLFKKKFLGPFVKMLGGIYVDRNTKSMGFIEESEEILRKGGVVGIFPEGRIPKPEEERPLPFTSGAAYIALATGAKVIPVFTDGVYFKKQRAKVVIGKPIDPAEFEASDADDKEKIENLTAAMRNKIIELGKMTDERQ